MMEQIVCVSVLGLNAVQDIRRREIVLAPTVAAGAAGVLWNLIAGHSGMATLLYGMIPGGILLFFAWLTGGQIGRGDGILVIACGAWCGFPVSLYLLCAGLFLALAGAVMLLAIRRTRFRLRFGQRRGEKGNSGKTIRASSIRVPFVPFLFAAYIILLLVAR
jgi:Flp pilus assembly protein protease CpaA